MKGNLSFLYERNRNIMIKKFTTFIILISVALCANAQQNNNLQTSYWNNNTPLVSYRLPPPPLDYKPILKDLDMDGDPDLIYSVTINNTPILWIDDDDDMESTDFEGDTDSDCLLIDVNKDGKYGDHDDVAVDWIDTDGDGDADMQVYVENSKADNPRMFGGGQHYFWVLDTDNDNVFNYIDWNTFEVRAWLRDGASNFLEDYHGESTFLKIHASTYYMSDVRLNWENPFLFFDPDNDGLSEMAARVLDIPSDEDMKAEAKTEALKLNGEASYLALTYDLDGDNNPGNEFDYDMSFRFTGKGFDYMDQVHPFKNTRLQEADSFFIDPRWRNINELIYPDHDSAIKLTYEKGDWEEIYFVYDEDDDCERWERVEFYEPLDLFKIGKRNGGLDNNPQADAIGDRGEWDLDNSGKANIYLSKFDGRIHLYGAEWGAWRIDQLANSFQGTGGYRSNADRTQKEFTPFSTFKYEDTDNNGFIDQIEMDIDGDTIFEKVVSLKALGINDECDVIQSSELQYKDYRKLHTTMSNQIWKRAETAMEVADKFGINTTWYAFMKSPKSENEKYRYGYWLQFYIYKDFIDLSQRGKGGLTIEEIDRAYFGGNWELLKEK